MICHTTENKYFKCCFIKYLSQYNKQCSSSKYENLGERFISDLLYKHKDILGKSYKVYKNTIS